MKKLFLIIMLSITNLLGFSFFKSSPKIKIPDVDKITKVEYFYGLRIPAGKDEECGTPYDAAIRRIRIDFNRRIADVVYFEDNRDKSKHSIEVSNKDIEDIRTLLKSLEIDPNQKKKFEKKPKGSSAEDLWITYSPKRNPIFEIFYLKVAKLVKTREKFRLGETKATPFFKSFLERKLKPNSQK